MAFSICFVWRVPTVWRLTKISRPVLPTVIIKIIIIMACTHRQKIILKLRIPYRNTEITCPPINKTSYSFSSKVLLACNPFKFLYYFYLFICIPWNVNFYFTSLFNLVFVFFSFLLFRQRLCPFDTKEHLSLLEWMTLL